MIIHLQNITIYQRQTTNDQTYYVIYDKVTNNSYFCFPNRLKEGWVDLVNHYQNIEEIELEFEENEKGNKVTSLFVLRKVGDILI